MEKQWYLVTLAQGDFAAFLSLCLDRASYARLYFPDESELGHGKQLFCSLPTATVAPWSGMEKCLMASFPLDSISTELVRAWLDPNDERQSLWKYDLWSGDGLFLRVEDFGVCLVLASPSDLKEFQSRGLDTRLWESVNLSGEPGLTTQPLSEEELRRMRDDLEGS